MKKYKCDITFYYEASNQKTAQEVADDIARYVEEHYLSTTRAEAKVWEPLEEKKWIK